MVFLLTYVASLMPFNLAFQDFETDSSWFLFDTIIDFAFVTDLIINCFTAFVDEEGKLVTSNKKIFFNYVKGWLIIDMIASFPFNLIQKEILDTASASSNAGNYNQILRLLRLPRLYRLLKITRLVKLVSFLKKNQFI